MLQINGLVQLQHKVLELLAVYNFEGDKLAGQQLQQFFFILCLLYSLKITFSKLVYSSVFLGWLVFSANLLAFSFSACFFFSYFSTSFHSFLWKEARWTLGLLVEAFFIFILTILGLQSRQRTVSPSSLSEKCLHSRALVCLGIDCF